MINPYPSDLRVSRIIESRGELYWGKDEAWNGFSHGPGFKAFAEDFPAGTRLRITAEIIFPQEPRDAE
jgi:hypothetical protein